MSDILVTVVDNPITVSTTDTTITATIAADTPISVNVAAIGNPGPGVPAGGTTGYQLTKASDTSYDTAWSAPTVPAGTDGLIQYNDGGVIGADTDLKWNKNTESLIIGLPDALPNNPLSLGRSVNLWLQANIQNTNEGATASTDWVATADNGTDLSNYVDMGINSSVYDSEDYPCMVANEAYVQAVAPVLSLMAAQDNAIVQVVVGGVETTNIVAVFDVNGLTMQTGKTIANRPEIYYGTSAPPSATGLADGTLYFRYA